MLQFIHKLLEAKYGKQLPQIKVINSTNSPFVMEVIFTNGAKRRVKVDINVEKGS